MVLAALHDNLLAEEIGFFTDGSKIPLKIDSSFMVIATTLQLNPEDEIALAISLPSVIRVDPALSVPGAVVCSIGATSDYYTYLNSISERENILGAQPLYRSRSGTPLPVSMRVCLGVRQTAGRSIVERLCDSLNLQLVKEVWPGSNIFILDASTVESPILDLCNSLYGLSEVSFCHPDFTVFIQPTGYRIYDYYRANQNHLQAVVGAFDVATAWDFAGTQGVVYVSLLDDGLCAHEDLPSARIGSGYDFSIPGDPDPTPGEFYGHGFACAGIIGASHSTDSLEGLSSNSGIVGVNPNVIIDPYKIYPDIVQILDKTATGISLLAQAIVTASEGAPIVSNSWGFGDASANYDVINNALSYATARAAVIFAAGNSGPDGIDYPANRCWNCVVVGAVTLEGQRWNYSPTGVTLVAPSGQAGWGDVWTIDRMDTSGENIHNHPPKVSWNCPTVEGNNTNYNCHFGGTSAACPFVAGVASLLISRDPSLRYNMPVLREILSYSAAPLSEYVPSPDFGYGRVDAFRALLAICRGDANNDAAIDLSDVSAIIAYLTVPGYHLFPSDLLGDWDCSASVDLSDLTRCSACLTSGGPGPAVPCYEY